MKTVELDDESDSEAIAGIRGTEWVWWFRF